MPTPNWQFQESARIRDLALAQAGVTEVIVKGSVAAGTADAFSDLDLEIRCVDTVLDISSLGLFEDLGTYLLGQERYVGNDARLFRLLLCDGRAYDLRFALPGADPSAGLEKVAMADGDEFWFALYAASHAYVRGRAIISLDLTLWCAHACTQRYWACSEADRQRLVDLAGNLRIGLAGEALWTSLEVVAKMGAIAYAQPARATCMLRLLAERQR